MKDAHSEGLEWIHISGRLGWTVLKYIDFAPHFNRFVFNYHKLFQYVFDKFKKIELWGSKIKVQIPSSFTDAESMISIGQNLAKVKMRELSIPFSRFGVVWSKRERICDNDSRLQALVGADIKLFYHLKGPYFIQQSSRFDNVWES